MSAYLTKLRCIVKYAFYSLPNWHIFDVKNICEICWEHISSISTGNNYSIPPPSSDVTSSYLISRYSL